jgi:hypothetical protein
MAAAMVGNVDVGPTVRIAIYFLNSERMLGAFDEGNKSNSQETVDYVPD